MLISELLLTHYDPKLPLFLAADALNYCVGAVISHILPNGSDKAIAYSSRTLTPAKNNYSQIEKGVLTIIYAVKKFRLWQRFCALNGPQVFTLHLLLKERCSHTL